MMTTSSDPLLNCAGPSVSEDDHRALRDDEFWRCIPAYSSLKPREFNDHRFQSRNCVTSVRKLKEVVGHLVSDAFLEDVERGVQHSTMSLRISPYILSLIDWEAPDEDPLRIQFLPLLSRFEADHPELGLDSLNEQEDSSVPGLTHRYADRALFLALDSCPVYCRFCTRSYAVGLDTDGVEKLHFGVHAERWEKVFSYVSEHEEIEDIVISGGDIYNLKSDHVELIGMRLLGIDHVRRLRYATKGPAVMPQKLISDEDWLQALTNVVEVSRTLHKEVAIHTHFNHPNEITETTRLAMNRLVERGITVRNQAVLQRRVNDATEIMQLLIKRLSYVNVHPYYVFVHDLVKGVEELRTTLQSAIELEKRVRGITAGFNIPAFVVDTMGGGGKRHVHSFEHYNRSTGIAVFSSPAVRPGQHFVFFDPTHQLSSDVRKAWADASERQRMIAEAVECAAAGVSSV